MSTNSSNMNSDKKIFIASDHAGYKMKERLKETFETRLIEFEDLGCSSEESVDYPVYGKKVAEKVLLNPNHFGVLICGTGVGMSMAANRFNGIRAALCASETAAKMSREHNDSNILVLGARITDEETAVKIFSQWWQSEFEGGRHLRRVKQINI